MKMIGTKIKNNYFLLTILFLSILLRIYGLGNESMWIDEIYSVTLSKLDLGQIVQQTSQDNHPPLYYFILYFWIDLFGDSAISVRFLSVIFGVLTILMIYKVGTLIFNKNIGLISSLLLAVSAFHIYYSQEARMYSLMTFLTLLSIYFFIKLINKISFTISIGYILSSILLIYTHGFGLFIILAQNIYFFTMFFSKEENKLNFKKWILFQIILVILYIPWINSTIIAISKFTDNVTWVLRPGIGTLISTFSIFSGRKLYLPLFLILLFFSIITYKKNVSNVNRINLLLIWLLTPIILPFIISLFTNPIYVIRYTIAASLAYYILVAKGIHTINNKRIYFISLILIIASSLNAVARDYTTMDKMQCKEVTSYIEKNANPGDLLVITWKYNQDFSQKYCYDYYSKRNDLNRKLFPEKADGEILGGVDEKNIKELGHTVKGYDRVFLIRFTGADPKGLTNKTLNKSHDLSYNKEFTEVSAYLFTKNK